MPQARTAPLRRELAAWLPDRPFSLRLWDGATLPRTRPGGPEVFVRSPRAIAHMLRSPTQLGVVRAYVAGDVDVDDLDALLPMVDGYKPAAPDRAARARLVLAALRAMGVPRPPRRPAAELRPRGQRHSKQRDAAAVRHHYDVSNEFFALFLDRSMTYSGAIFSHGAKTLEQAQEAKHELVCEKLCLEPGARVLDIGCGWGAFAIHAARRHGARVLGVTISERQAELGRKRVREEGLENDVEIRLADYRDLAGERFDAIASIGMIEHVGGSQVDAYAATVAALLRPGARFLCQGIGKVPPSEHRPSEFSKRYVFPDGQLLHLSRMLRAFELAGLENLHAEAFREDYAETLRHWAERLDRRLDEGRLIAGAERTRVWRLYLRMARHAFSAGFASLFQMLSVLPGPAPQAAVAREVKEPRQLAVPQASVQ
ncbi:MAG: class I SAM-dependent methyltransferase [Thermoleophilaceae bacterium]|nr:class I SAM-dependent methyltransferase [Thermoleophilaceae bacterium]